MPNLTIIQGDCRLPTDQIPDGSIHCVVTSPPYWGLRDYGTARWEGGDSDCEHIASERHYTEKTAATSSAGAFSEPGPANAERLKKGRWRERGECTKCGAQKIDAQIGMEWTPEEFVANIVAVFREIHRCLRDDGTVWLNLGDCHSNIGKWGGCSGGKNAHSEAGGIQRTRKGSDIDPKRRGIPNQPHRSEKSTGLKPKDLVGIPWRVAFALQSNGWYLRQWMPWVKRNAMPESVTDRPATSCETIFLLSKSQRYFYDGEAVKMPVANASIGRLSQDTESQIGTERANGGRKTNGNLKAVGDIESGRTRRNGDWFLDSDWQGMLTDGDGWPVAMVINPMGYKGAHFATFPPKLVQPCVLAGTSAKGCCPCCGAPWERIVEKGEPDIEHQRACGGDQSGNYDGTSTKDYTSGGAQDASATKARILAGMRERITTRWEPSCACFHLPGHADPVPCRVLDPFLGSGTTAEVAISLGRHAYGRELNPEYISLAEQRTNTTIGLQLV